jgi:MFS family permease
LALAVPQMTDPLKQGFLALGAVSSIGYVAYSIGSYFGGRIVSKFGIKNSYRAALTARALIWTAAAVLFKANLQAIPVAGLAGLFALDYFVHAISRVAEGTLQVSWFKDKPLASARFGTARDFIEYGTVFSTLGTGLIISIWGFSPIVFATPVLFGVAALIAYFLKDMPGKPQDTSAAKPNMLAGFKALFGDKTLLKLWAPQLLINNFFYGFYYIFATAFGVLAANGVAEKSALVSSALMGVFGIGAVAGTFIMTWLGNRIDKKTAALPEGEQAAAQKAMLAKSGASALRWSAAALLGVFAFAFPSLLGTFVWPIYAVTPALLLIGMTAQVALGHLDPMFKERMPKETAGHILGAQRTLTYFSYALTFNIWGAMFQWLGAGAFWALGGVSIVAAALYLLLAKKIQK